MSKRKTKKERADERDHSVPHPDLVCNIDDPSKCPHTRKLVEQGIIPPERLKGE